MNARKVDANGLPDSTPPAKAAKKGKGKRAVEPIIELSADILTPVNIMYLPIKVSITTTERCYTSNSTPVID